MLFAARALVRARAPDVGAARATPALLACGGLGGALGGLGGPLLGGPPLGGVRFATSKAGGASKNGRDSRPKFLGVKRFGGERVEPGHIIVRQRGARVGIVESTASVGMGRDHTIFALKPGFVKFWYHRLRRKSYVEVVRSPPPPPALQQALVFEGDEEGGAGAGEGAMASIGAATAAAAAARAAAAAAAALAAAPLKYPVVRVKRGDLPQLLKLVEKGERAASAPAGAPAPASAASGDAAPAGDFVVAGGIEMSAEVRRQLLAFRAARDAAGRRPPAVAAAAMAAAAAARLA